MTTIPRRLLPQRVTIRPLIGAGAYGNKYGDPVTVRARVSLTRKVVRDKTGAEVVAEATVILPAGTRCPLESMIRLPGDEHEHERTVITYGQSYGARAPHHVEITAT